ncbi:RNA polymerase subunit sigma-24 [Ammoniphilus oxalaticus]|uniref:RNA polymerase subunit sigma-24 n=1 Tax=Ammoniphilus oxalaticus TaxID=66863 RepID=A0A419SP76_9BACL|nr:sigma-70 family RNA polymerase sigma factor [Ammoniphilus oxalaticus]RKD26011.1 RNA polymerase subunit sigma-24 [Ammoniphilus oxalaticus]
MDLPQSALVKRIKNEDVLAYEYMINKYTKTIYYLAHHILSPSLSKEDIEECVSDVFLEAWTRIDEFDEEKGNFRTWLLMLTKYKALTYRRKRTTDQVIAMEDFEIEDSYSLEKDVFLRRDQEKVIEIINSFNDVDRKIFLRRFFYNEKISDLAKAFNFSRSAIDNRLYRGRKMIKEALDYGGSENESPTQSIG